MLFWVNCKKNYNSDLIILGNKKIEVGILPEVGGRIVLLRKPGLKNMLKSDEQLWQNPEKHKPEVSAFSTFKAFYGHIVWVGPQSEWWQYQEINEARRKAKADWPPDPYLIYGKFDITYQSDSIIKMIGPESPISGVRLYKEISIDNSGVVTFTAIAENIREKSFSCDLWMNTRLDGDALGYVPINDEGILELLVSENKTRETTPYRVENGYFTFQPSVPRKPRKEQVQEVHLYPSEGLMAGFSEQQMLLIRFNKYDQHDIHSQHGLVELYSYISDNENDRLLELELHSAYRTLAPGETITLTETWELFPYNGDNTTQDHIKFLKSNLSTFMNSRK